MTSINSGRMLRITLISGLILLSFTTAVITGFNIYIRSAGKSVRQEDSFYSLMRDYDKSIADFFGTEREYDHFNKELDSLEKKTISVESWLSVLKRRRNLSLKHSQSLVFYRNSLERAAAAYPASQQIAALKAGSLIKDSAVTKEEENQIRLLLPLLSDPSFNIMRLAFHILLGDFKNPGRASLIPSDIVSDGTESINLDLAVLKTYRRNYRAALADIQIMLSTEDTEQLTEDSVTAAPLSENILNFAAEFHYDFGELPRSAELFSLINNSRAMSRQADALYLAGFEDSAKSLWKILSQAQSGQTSIEDSRIEISLYNLAVSAQNENNAKDAETLLERLEKTDTDFSDIQRRDSRQYGLIRLSRLKEITRASSLLMNDKYFSPQKFPYIDLEISKRYTHVWNLNRQTAETWMLLDRHSENEDLYKWAAWHFFFQRRYDEIPIFLDRLDLHNPEYAWVDLYKALKLMNDGNLQAAENILLSIPENNAGWTVNANLGRIYDEVRSPSRALHQYELAASKLEFLPQSGKAASRVRQRIASCFTALNRQNDAMRALLTAIDLDPENNNARLELERLMY